MPVVLGGEGVISVIAQGFPDKVSKMVSLARKSQVEKAFSIFYKIIEMIDLICEEGNPTGIRTFLNIIGICNPYVRLPLLIGSTSIKKKMLNLFKQINL